MTPIETANRASPDRITVAGVLAVRCLRYLNQAVVPSRALADIRVRSLRSGESPLFHASTGIYGFLRLAPGEHRLHLNDPSMRFLPRAARVTVPDRSDVVRALERGGLPAAGAAPPTYADIALRPAIGYAVPAGETAIWGQVTHADGRPAAFARLLLDTRHEDADTQVLSYADAAGTYLLRLPGERASFVPPEDTDADGTVDTTGDLVQQFDRPLVVHTLRQDPLGLDEPLDAFPEDFDTLDPDAAGGPYQAAAFELRNPASGEIRPPVGPVMPLVQVRIGRKLRWDIVLS